MDPFNFLPKLLFTYGPFALIVFVVYKVIIVIKRPPAGSSQAEKNVYLAIYTAAWALVFFLAIVIVQVWKKMNLPAEAVISGTIRNLKDPESVWSEPNSPLFVRRVYRDQTHEPGQYDYEWRIVTVNKSLEPVEFDLQDKPNHSKTYRLDLKESYYHNEVHIVYHRDRGILVLKEGAKEEPLPVVEAALKHPEPPLITSLVYAQSEPSVGDISRALTSDDPIIRRSAAEVLAQQGMRAIPTISSALTSKDASYRTKLGVIAALDKMKRPDAKGISDEAKRAVLQLAMTEQDQTLRAAALEYIGSIMSDDRAFRDMRPVALGLLPSGLVVLDAPNGHVWQLSARGSVDVKDLRSYDVQDMAAAQVDGQDVIFVLMRLSLSPASSWLHMYTPQGSEKKTWPVPGKASSLAFDANRQLVYAVSLKSGTSFEVYRLDPRASGSSFKLVAELTNKVHSIGGAAVDGVGNRFFAAGDVLEEIDLGAAHPHAKTLLEGGLGSPLAIAVNATGSVLYAADPGHRLVWKVPLDAAAIKPSSFSRDARFRKPDALVVDSAGDVWLGDSDAKAIFLLSPTGEVIAALSAKR
jgi:hypothetical protein